MLTKAAGYMICNRCVMDTSDPEIMFDKSGICSWCHKFDMQMSLQWMPNEDGRKRFQLIVDEIREERRSFEYDCIVGLSGGVDSTYAAYVAKRIWGLRILAVHVDAGWNSELAVKNIENIVKSLDIDLHTEVIDWDEMRDVQLAFLKSGVPNQDIPQDHVFFAALYRCASKMKIRHVLSGGNIATESVLPTAWGYNAMDLRHLRSIHRLFGSRRIRTYPTCSFFQYYIYYPFIRRMRVIRPLNYVPYVRDDAIALLEKELGFRYYGMKHGESRFTKFFQNYWLPSRFKFDKRRAHLASLVLSGQATRADAIAELDQAAYPPDQLREDRAFIAKKLGLNAEDLAQLEAAPTVEHAHYPSNQFLFGLKDRVRPALYAMGLRFVTK